MYEDYSMEILGYLVYGTASLLFWWIYPHTLSRVQLFSTSAVQYWIGRIAFALFGPALVAIGIAYLYVGWTGV